MPTVKVGDVALVNPSAPDVLRAVAEHAPDHLPADYDPPEPGLAARLVTRLLGG